MKLERLTTSADSVSAAVVKGLLEGAGIPIMLRAYQSAGWLFPGTPGSLGAMEVLVPGERLEQARRVLAEAEAEAAATEAAVAKAAAAEVAAAGAGKAGAAAAATAAEATAAGGEGARGRTRVRRGASRSRGARDGPRDRSGAVD